MTKNISRSATLEQRLSRYTVDPVTGCWNWDLCIDGGTGYGKLGFEGRADSVHVFAYKAWVGPIPEGKQVNHRCRENRRCINPDHLYAGTQAENMSDRVRDGNHHYANQTHCFRGHPLSGANLYVPPSKPNGRECRVCRKLRR